MKQNIHGWIEIDVTSDVIAQAKGIREQRDKQYRNIYEEKSTDLRWVGELGEILFDQWLISQTVKHVWIQDDAAGKPDFYIGDVRVDVKTVKRTVPMRPEYEAQITKKHASEDVDYYFFATYIIPQNRLLLLGGMEKAEYLKRAKYYGPGDKVHAKYTIRPGHEIYNIEAYQLIQPAQWLNLRFCINLRKARQAQGDAEYRAESSRSALV